MLDETELQKLLRARQCADDALGMGDVEIEYRGYWIDIEHNDRGWDYLLDGNCHGESLEDVFRAIDERAGSTEEEIGRLNAAWNANLGL